MGTAKVLVHLGQLNTRLEDNEADVSGRRLMNGSAKLTYQN